MLIRSVGVSFSLDRAHTGTYKDKERCTYECIGAIKHVLNVPKPRDKEIVEATGSQPVGFVAGEDRPKGVSHLQLPDLQRLARHTL